MSCGTYRLGYGPGTGRLRLRFGTMKWSPLLPVPAANLGLAVDLGSTKVAAYLVDLSNGHTLAAKGIMNPQISYGEDIVSRITRVITLPAEGKRLQEMAVEAINQLAATLCTEVGAEVEEIVEAVVVGNTAMHHLLLRLPVRQLAYSPFCTSSL